MSIVLMSPEAAAAAIRAGRVLHLAGEEEVLAGLPTGTWTGGTIPYFFAPKGVVCDRRNLLVADFDVAAGDVEIDTYDADGLGRLLEPVPGHGYRVVLLPGFSAIHKRFALMMSAAVASPDYPLAGWVSGVHLSNMDLRPPRVFDGRSGRGYDDRLVELRVRLPSHRLAKVGVVNIFTPGDGPTIVFEDTAFETTNASINGTPVDFANWLYLNGINGITPLLATHAGATIAVSFRRIDPVARRVSFYAPVLAGVAYRLARPLDDYRAAIERACANLDADEIPFSCNCMFNYLYGELEGQGGLALPGPATFGEIASVLLNQTLVYLQVTDR
jgi:hypothetical protein